MKIVFRGVDKFNRPVFKAVEKNLYFGSTVHLVNFDTTEEEALEVFKGREHLLEYFGTSFGCEPTGGRLDGIKIVKKSALTNSKE